MITICIAGVVCFLSSIFFIQDWNTSQLALWNTVQIWGSVAIIFVEIKEILGARHD